MSKQISKKPVVIAMGAALTGGLLAAGSVNAATNPFGLSELGSGYMQVAEAQCGAKPAAMPEPKAEEGKCGGAAKPVEPKAEEGKCGGAAKPVAPKAKEGKCGEAKCGASMNMDK